MATHPTLSALTSARTAESELARRIALAREPSPEQVAGPRLARLVGEGAYLAEPFIRPFRKIEISPARDPQIVMILPGFATSPSRMGYLARHLERAGHKTKRWGLGPNLGPSEDKVAKLEQRLQAINRRYGRLPVLLGWSLGGLFARELARRQPGQVHKVITMGSPFSGSPRANNVWRLYQFVTGHRVDSVPLEFDVRTKPPVETVALWSPRDGMIAPRSACGLPGERDRAVALRCTHMGFSHSREAIAAILAELDRD